MEIEGTSEGTGAQEEPATTPPGATQLEVAPLRAKLFKRSTFFD